MQDAATDSVYDGVLVLYAVAEQLVVRELEGIDKEPHIGQAKGIPNITRGAAAEFEEHEVAIIVRSPEVTGPRVGARYFGAETWAPVRIV